ncbi:hypothetical protein PVK06_048438 [Gossypium arboreum]|uniref:Putative plant transposon protein domain-containing protein n=1 Tax=Gossypium arboreum TaxID=29729 RepID=A0ABR0MGG2_GOSAR|nr:hypothetical protein PVK06_048438 [Gossypium arboreum]
MSCIHQVVETLNWELFCEKRPSMDDEVVREFYVNLTSSKMTEVPGRGINVSINSNSINDFFELPDFENDEYSTLMRNIKLENLQEILEELTVQGSTWIVSKQGIHTKRIFDATHEEDPDEEEDPTMQSFEVPDKVGSVEPEAKPDAETSMLRAQLPSPDLRDELSKLMDLMQHMQWQQQAYWRYSKIRDDSMRSAFKKIYNDPFIFVPKFPDFIFEPWSSLSKKKQSDSCKGDSDGAKDESNSKRSANK